jgi:hypothetical protein
MAMPLALTLAYMASPRIFASRVPAWRRLLALADAAAAQLTILWQGLFTDARGSVRLEALARTLEAPNILEAQALVSQTWHMAVEVPARRLLPVLATETITDAARLMEPTVSRLVGQPVTYTTGLPETAQWVNEFVGTQIRDITATTRQAVQQTLRAGWNAGTAPRPLARQIRDVIGLTPRQGQTIERLRERLEAQGKTATEVQRSVAQATAKAIRYRAETISRTESITLANRGSHETLLNAVRRGYVEEERVRRFWLLTPGACETCQEVPGMNPDGVGANEPFQTPLGTVMFPTLHPRCRCTTTTSLVA